MSKRKNISLASLIMITVVSVDSIRNLPVNAKFGAEMITFYLIAAIFFLIPTTLVAAELSAKFKCSGGIYTWVKEAYGDTIGLFAIYLQWIENVIWYPLILSFVAGSLSSCISADLASSPIYLFIAIPSIFWLLTYINLKGLSSSAKFSDFCTISGLVLPMMLIILLGCIWLFLGNTSAIELNSSTITPKLDDIAVWSSLITIMLSFSGMEIATVHAAEIDGAQDKFPKALLYSAAIIFITLLLGSLAIAIVIPSAKINYITGIIDAFQIFFQAFHAPYLLPIIALTLAIGATGSVSNWIIAPTKGLLFAAKDNNIPSFFGKTNKEGAPTNLLYAQAVIVTVLATIFLVFPEVNKAYWVLTLISSQLYMVMYIIMFFSFVKIRSKKTAPDSRHFKVPGGNFGKWLIAILGVLGCTLTFIVGFIQPDEASSISSSNYIVTILATLCLLCIPPFVLIKRNRTQTK